MFGNDIRIMKGKGKGKGDQLSVVALFEDCVWPNPSICLCVWRLYIYIYY